ncbi:thiolase family protein [Rhodopila globiformis]|uniref:Thiolase N-terminal domain-containing protein n=1 Tax=Rhodopila globiformis TaxID=1071 RepID=A0A2S6NH40_RHOGL|nr:hypothetical protein [Rhodopila globiformis]PPQ33920.1 hypothetical protein CCS01_13295 [Rhodopila globiformis]
MSHREVVLCNGLRTAIGKCDVSLRTVSVPALGTIAVRAVMRRSSLKGSDVDAAIMGNVIQTGYKINPVLQERMNAGLPVVCRP